MRTARQPYNPEAERQRLIRLLHVARRDLRMEDADYRAVLSTASKGVHDSSKDMSATELERALAHMKRCGFKVRTKAKSASAKPKPSRALAGDLESKKIRALWLMLHDLGAVKNPSEAALAVYVKRITHVDDLHWINGEQAETLIETLKKWALRYLPDAIQKLVPQVKTAGIGYMQAMRLNEALSHAYSRGTFDPMHSAWQALNDVLAPSAAAVEDESL
ncbi:MAG: regulatory protein GemA [Rhodocyclaceae bacterium]|nr:regulatory protein GemA [Rhodocyclaceae bacterium]